MLKIKPSIIFLFLAYLISRLINITALPIFNDEAFFIWVGRQIAKDPLKNLFINFTDGKEPLFFWIYSIPVSIFPDAVLAIRLLTVFFGFITLVYFLKIAAKIKINPFWAGLLFVVNPFLLFYQRIGMQETLLTMFLTGAVYYLLEGKKILTGVFLGLSLLTKTSAGAFIIFLIPILLLKRSGISLIVATVLYFPAVWGFTNISSHNQSYIGVISWGQIFSNLKQTLRWTTEYLGWPLTILGLPAIIPGFLESFIAKIYFPRYFLFCIPFVILSAIFLAGKIKIRPLRYLMIFILIAPNFILSFQILINIETAKLPYIERWQYIESWPSGYGIFETAEFLRREGAKDIVVEDVMATQYGLAYYYPQGNYHKDGPGDYYVFAREQATPADKSLVLQFSKIKPGGREKITVYKKYE